MPFLKMVVRYSHRDLENMEMFPLNHDMFFFGNFSIFISSFKLEETQPSHLLLHDVLQHHEGLYSNRLNYSLSQVMKLLISFQLVVRPSNVNKSEKISNPTVSGQTDVFSE